MTIGYRNGSECYLTADEAIDAHYTGSPIPVFISSNTVNSITFIKDAGVWKMNFQVNQNTYLSNSVYVLPSFTPPTCTMEASPTGTVPQGLPEGFDYTILAALFAFSFSVVVGLWLFGKSAGSIVNIFKPK